MAHEYWALISPWLTDPWLRAAGLLALVFLTIWLIASIYASASSSSEYGPVAIRKHVAKKLGKKDIAVSRDLLPTGLDGVIATCDVFYYYFDAKGRRRKVCLKSIDHAKLHVRPGRIPAVRDMADGTDVPQGVRSEDVVFPPIDPPATPPETLPATPETAHEYCLMHNLKELFTDEDGAVVVSVSEETLRQISENRAQFIVDAAGRNAKARSRPAALRFLRRQLSWALRDKRPNVMGTIVIKFRFSKNPFFILSKHPDRELRMTAWLTVLTSVFAIVMDLWPVSDHWSRSTAREPAAKVARPH